MNDPLTPREQLLGRRADRTRELDAIRHDAVQSLSRPTTWRGVLIELFRLHRTAWRMLAATWLTLAAFHFATHRVVRSPAPSSTSPEALAAWLDQLKSHETLAQIDRHQ